jgi:hypothetical protein
MLAIKPANGRYLKVSLCKDGVIKQHQVHRLVLLAFVGEPPSGFECDHIDSDIRNNSLNNLRWLSRADNLRRRLSVKITDEIVASIRVKSAGGVETAKLAVDFGISKRHVRQVVTAKCWKAS